MQDLERCGDRHLGVARRILSWAEAHDPPVEIIYGTGKTYSSMQFGVSGEGYRIFPFFLYSSGAIEIRFELMVSYPYSPFDDEAKRLELKRRLEEIPGVTIDQDRIDKRPSFELTALEGAAALGQFFAAIDWTFEEAMRTGSDST